MAEVLKEWLVNKNQDLRKCKGRLEWEWEEEEEEGDLWGFLRIPKQLHIN